MKKKKYALLQLEMTMEESLKMKVFKDSVKRMKFFTIFQQNGVVERKNMSLQEMERTTFNDNSTPMYF